MKRSLARTLTLAALSFASSILVVEASSEMGSVTLPVIEAPTALTVRLGETFQYRIKAPDGALGFSVVNAPYWVTREGNLITGEALSLGEHVMSVRAVNMNGAGEAQKLTIRVIDPKAE